MTDLIERLESGADVTDEEVLLALGYAIFYGDAPWVFSEWLNPKGQAVKDVRDFHPTTSVDDAIRLTDRPIEMLRDAWSRLHNTVVRLEMDQVSTVEEIQAWMLDLIPRHICAAILRSKTNER